MGLTFYLACFQGSSILKHVLALHFFLRLNNNPLHGYNHILFIHQLTDICIVSIHWLL